jgi:hypothetical protein
MGNCRRHTPHAGEFFRADARLDFSLVLEKNYTQSLCVTGSADCVN